MAASPTFLVTGASGQLGRRVVEHLLATRAGTIIAASRDPAKLAALAAKGAQTRRIDFDDAASLDAALKGVDRLLIISTDDVLTPGRRLRQQTAAVEAAARAKVGHVVYTSMPHPEPGSLIPFAPDHYGTEQALAKSALPHTILRVSWYVENLLRALPSVFASGKWYSAAGEGKLANIARDDVARAAASALVKAPGGVFNLTGPDLLTTRQIAALVAEVFDKKIEFISVNDEQLLAGLLAAGLPKPIAELTVAFDANTRAGKVDLVTDAVEKLTGQKPIRLRDAIAALKPALSA
ncbi:MAG: KR domain-containing protein [Bradyrhizobium sp.]|nr:MAG: KR domain-containing protein [Bradyrhizobium sp.]